jgi:folate-dependent phosphoribosylglycinamide formyltransferase PurN
VNIAVLCGAELDGFQRAVLESVLGQEEHRVRACMVDVRPPPSALERLRTNLRRGRGGYVLVMALSYVFRRTDERVEAEQFLAGRPIQVIRTTDPYDPRTLEQLERTKPDVLLLVGGLGIVRAPILGVAPHGVLSYHHGDMRRYRGQPPGFWELYNGETEIGVTVQRLSAGIDCGEPILERRFPIRSTDTLRSLLERILTGSTDMMLEAVARLDAPGFSPERIERYGKVYTLPDLRRWLLYNLRVGGRVLLARLERRAP